MLKNKKNTVYILILFSMISILRETSVSLIEKCIHLLLIQYDSLILYYLTSK